MMKVTELRAAIREMTEPCKGTTAKGVYRMPDGSLVSKAKREPLLKYYSELIVAKVSEGEEPTVIEPATVTIPMENKLYKRYLKKVRKYTKRRQTPGNVRTLARWQGKLERMEASL